MTERRARDRENLKVAILEAAEEIFLAEDYSAVSIRRIADKIEYSPTTIYLYYKDKQEILYQLTEKGATMLAETLEQVNEPDPFDRLYKGGLAYIDFALRHPQYFKLMFQVEDTVLAERCASDLKPMERSFAFIGLAIGQALVSGQVRTDIPIEILSHVLWAHMHGAASLALAARLKKLPAELLPAFFAANVRICLDGIRAR